MNNQNVKESQEKLSNETVQMHPSTFDQEIPEKTIPTLVCKECGRRIKDIKSKRKRLPNVFIEGL